jgi:hypothetical protein
MENDHFFVTLPSNSSREFFGRQEPHNYKTKLAKPITVDPARWEVGLAEIKYPKSWENLTSDNVIRIYLQDGGVFRANLPRGRYADPVVLVDHFKRAIQHAIGEENKNLVHVEYLDDRRTLVRLGQGTALVIPPVLATMLGWITDVGLHLSTYNGKPNLVPDSRHLKNLDRPLHLSDMTVYSHRTLYTMYIYCDVVAYQRVGDTMAPLLRTVAVDNGADADIVSYVFDKIHYTPICRSVFDTIEIHLTDELGADLSFKQGYVTVKLHFRKKR